MLAAPIAEFRVDFRTFGSCQWATAIQPAPTGGLMGLITSPLRLRCGGGAVGSGNGTAASNAFV